MTNVRASMRHGHRDIRFFALSLIVAVLTHISPPMASAQSLNPSGLALADDDAIYDHLVAKNITTIYEVAQFLDQLEDPKRPRRAAKAAKILAAHRADISALCDERGINPYFAVAVIAAESAGRTDAVSPVGAAGLMQIMPGTADDLDVLDRKRSTDSIFGGCRYLAQMRENFGEDEFLILAAYNAGPGAVRKYGGVPPFRETRRYIISVARSWPELTTD